MATKQLRTVKKSNQTGRLNRAEVRSAVITMRDKSAGQDENSGGSGASRNTKPSPNKSGHSEGKSQATCSQ
jgi:hypothetical protein